MREKRANIHKLHGPVPYQLIAGDTPAAAQRHCDLHSNWGYFPWLAKMQHGMIHYSVDGVGETFLMPRDNWQDVLAAFIGRKDPNAL